MIDRRHRVHVRCAFRAAASLCVLALASTRCGPTDATFGGGGSGGDSVDAGPGGGGTGGGVYRPGNGVESPRLLRSVRPNYTAEAMRAKVQGIVRLEGVVMAYGSVGDVKITRSLDGVFGLDQEAIKAAKQFRFVPGTRFGEPVAVLVSFEIEFTLR